MSQHNHISYPIISQETIKQLQEELRSIEEAEKLCRSFSDWLSSAQKNYSAVIASSEPLDRVAMERKMKKLEVWLRLRKYSLDGLCCVG